MSIVEERSYSQERAPIQPASTAPLAVPSRRGIRGITGAVLLIGLGSALLLSNLGIVAINWLAIAQLWPLILILVGIDMVLAGRSAAGSVLAALLALVIAFGAIFWASTSDTVIGGGPIITRPIEVAAMGNVETLQVNLELGAGNTTVNASDDTTHAAVGEYRSTERVVLRPDYREKGNIGMLTVTQDGNEVNNFSDFAGNLTLELTKAVPINLDVDAGVGTLDLNLGDLILQALTIHAGVGNVDVTLPDSGTYTVDVDAGMGNVEIRVPEGVEAQINYDSGLGKFDTDSRFTRVDDDTLQTAGFENADERITINVNAGVGNIDIR